MGIASLVSALGRKSNPTRSRSGLAPFIDELLAWRCGDDFPAANGEVL